jgi:hypothetical protein
VDTPSVIALISTIVATAIAIVVPQISFRLTLRIDHTRWMREQRAAVYVDLLTEAYAEQQWLEFDMADDEQRKRMRTHEPDLRLPPLERARLGVRASMYGSKSVNRLFNLLPAEMFWSTPFSGKPTEGEKITARMRVSAVVDELQKVIRAEMETDHVLPAAYSALLREPHPAERAMQEQVPDVSRQREPDSSD